MRYLRGLLDRRFHRRTSTLEASPLSAPLPKGNLPLDRGDGEAGSRRVGAREPGEGALSTAVSAHGVVVPDERHERLLALNERGVSTRAAVSADNKVIATAAYDAAAGQGRCAEIELIGGLGALAASSSCRGSCETWCRLRWAILDGSR